MEQQQSVRDNPLAFESTGRLIAKYSVPSVIAMLVSSLYNIVDQIFIGQGVGMLGNAATNVAFPFVNICIALSLLIGIGGASNFNLNMGRGENEKAKSYAGTSISLLILSGLALSIFSLLFLKPILIAFGSTKQVFPYALTYTRITALGFPFLIATNGFCNLIRSDGSPRYSMVVMVTGAVINTCLDPLFIFGFHWGIAGGAAATVIGQIGGMTLGLVLNQAKNVELRLHLKGFRPNKTILKGILDVGFPSIIMQSISSVMNVLMNMILLGFGATAVNVLGVYFKLQSFVFMPVFGLSNGLVAILGYNYGARMRARVYDALKVALIWAAAIMLLGTLAFLLIPETLLGLFEAGNARDLTDMGVVALRVISLSFLLAAVGITISTLFQAVGKGMYSLWMSLCRQIIVLLPVAWLLSKTGNVDAVWWSFPIAELFSVALCLLLYRRVDRNMLQKL